LGQNSPKPPFIPLFSDLATTLVVDWGVSARFFITSNLTDKLSSSFESGCSGGLTHRRYPSGTPIAESKNQ